MPATDIRLPSPIEMDRNSLRATCADGPAGHHFESRIELASRFLVLVAVIVSCTTSLFAQTSGCNPPVPHVGCLTQDFEGLPPNILDPCGAGERPDPGTGMDHVGSNANSRFRFMDRTTLNTGWTMPPASPTAGDTVLILDTSTGTSVSTFVFHVDVTPFAGGEFVLSYRLLNNLDEAGPNDVVAIQDGVTAGSGVLAQNTPSGSPGLDGFKEVLLNDWIVGQHNGGQGPTAIRAWTCFTHTIDAAFYAANGLVPSGDLRILFRQQDNAFFEGNDGLAIDEVRICPQPGQAPDPLLSFFDINSAVTPSCQPVSSGANGPYYCDSPFGANIQMQVGGQPDQPIVLLLGTLNFGSTPLPPANGQLDLDLSTLLVIADGTVPGFLNQIFNTGPSGTLNLSFPINSALGQYPIQAAVFNSTSAVVKFSNTVVLDVTP